MAGGGSGGSAGGGRSGGLGRAGLIVLALLGGIAGIVIVTGITGGSDDDPPAAVDPTPPPPGVTASTSTVTATATATSGPTGRPTTSFDKEALRAGNPDAVVVTVAAYGLPARVSLVATNSDELLSQGMFDPGKGVDFSCLPDDQYPNPCVGYLVVTRGAEVTVTAGNSRAGFWGILDRLEGGGCSIPGSGGDQDTTCSFSAFQDADISAYYYGETTPSGRFDYPTCPVAAERGTYAATSWIARCQ